MAQFPVDGLLVQVLLSGDGGRVHVGQGQGENLVAVRAGVFCLAGAAAIRRCIENGKKVVAVALQFAIPYTAHGGKFHAVARADGEHVHQGRVVEDHVGRHPFFFG